MSKLSDGGNASIRAPAGPRPQEPKQPYAPSMLVWIDADMRSAELVQGDGFGFAVLSSRKPNKTEPNDDAAMACHWPCGDVVLAVADGVGGGPLGHEASAIAMRCLSEGVADLDKHEDFRPKILDAIEAANQRILKCGTGASTTLTVVEIHNGVARVYQIGDSMALILGGRGRIKYRSVCHSPIGYALESGFLSEDEAMHHEERHYVSNIVGSREMSIEVGPTVQLATRDMVLVASDGLFDNVSIDEVVARSTRGPIHKRIDQLSDLASLRMRVASDGFPSKPDDLTIALWQRQT